MEVQCTRAFLGALGWLTNSRGSQEACVSGMVVSCELSCWETTPLPPYLHPEP